MSFADWSTNAASNITVGGINIAENCPPSSLNNAAREMMAELRTAFSTALATFNAAADLPAARVALGVLPLTGGTVTGNITRGSAGSHLYHTNAAFASGRVFFTAPGDPDPTSLAGDIWITGS